MMVPRAVMPSAVMPRRPGGVAAAGSLGRGLAMAHFVLACVTNPVTVLVTESRAMAVAVIAYTVTIHVYKPAMCSGSGTVIAYAVAVSIHIGTP